MFEMERTRRRGAGVHSRRAFARELPNIHAVIRRRVKNIPRTRQRAFLAPKMPRR
jgi:hypothetical protein